jgi:hypothetical protein
MPLRRLWRRTNMWKDLRQLLAGLWRRSQKLYAERRVVEERARFWAGVREGQREAEAHSRP